MCVRLWCIIIYNLTHVAMFHYYSTILLLVRCGQTTLTIRTRRQSVDRAHISRTESYTDEQSAFTINTIDGKRMTSSRCKREIRSVRSNNFGGIVKSTFNLWSGVTDIKGSISWYVWSSEIPWITGRPATGPLKRETWRTRCAIPHSSLAENTFFDIALTLHSPLRTFARTVVYTKHTRIHCTALCFASPCPCLPE